MSSSQTMIFCELFAELRVFFTELIEFGAELIEFSLSLPKQYSRNSILPVAHLFAFRASCFS